MVNEAYRTVTTLCSLYSMVKHKVISRGVGVIGTSKGGEIALEMAAFIPSVIACVAINAPCVPVLVGMRVGEHLYPGIPFSNIHNAHIKDDGRHFIL
ncbi:Acyl-coenzyme A amino acid N-acyltransferase 2 [Portunus trituberculatus]|uniref:Acyl-coenzyme A amino acid N-acyltransferase 2 n=1 Tax=Portunus trituberculatus TaxID=210409 RepID=A0A5B7IET6_PORTR|nr:Acyl-coenzyme A amino acid N-acyltransferase 2 [Portunus trituberculatus]